MAKIYKMTWNEVFQRIEKIESQKMFLDPHHRPKIFGIPRGGLCAAAFFRHAVIVTDPAAADVLIDDIVDSGRTRDRYMSSYPSLPFFALVDKRGSDAELPWVQFPWEHEAGPEDSVQRLLQFIGEDVTRDGLLDTPKRVVKALGEMTAGYKMDVAALLGRVFKQNHDQMIISNGIRFTSLCEHHMLPFTGVCAVGYIPHKGQVVGLSKLARTVDVFSRRLQIQERLTEEVALAIDRYVKPAGVGVIMKAHHSCMSCRGARQPDSDMITSAMLGIFRDDPRARAEFLQLSGICK